MQYINETNKYINPIWATFHQNPTSPAILQLIEKPATWFDMQNKFTGFYMHPKTQKSLNLRWTLAQNGLNLKKKEERVKVLMFRKFFVELISFYKKPTCFKKHLHRRQGQSGFHFLIFILNDKREVQLFIFWGTIAQIFGTKNDMISVHTSLFLVFYYILPGEFLGCM